MWFPGHCNVVARAWFMWFPGHCYVVARVLFMWFPGHCYVVARVWFMWFPGHCNVVARVLFMWFPGHCYVVARVLVCGFLLCLHASLFDTFVALSVELRSTSLTLNMSNSNIDAYLINNTEKHCPE